MSPDPETFTTIFVAGIFWGLVLLAARFLPMKNKTLNQRKGDDHDDE
jgi:hypothetical protein